MKKGILISLAMLSMTALFAQGSGYTVNGKIKEGEKVSEAYLIHIVDGKQSMDSVQIKNGKFKFTGKAEAVPASASLLVRHAGDDKTKTYYLRDALELYLENKNMELTAKDSIRNAVIKGSTVNAEDQYIKNQIKPIRARIDYYVKIYGKYPHDSKDPGFKSAQDSCRMLLAAERKVYTDFITTHRNSYMALRSFNIVGVPYNFNPQVADSSFSLFSEQLKNSKLGEQLKQKIDIAKKKQPGRKVLDFVQNDADGNPVNLYDFRGKYVFVDFWASWCTPCRAENPNLVAAYKKLKDKNFQIISVSLDESKKSWLGAVAHDSLPWIQVSDLKGFKNEAAMQYGIDAIPQNILISPDGMILATNLRGEDLYDKIYPFMK